MRRLLINCDDLGYHPTFNEAIAEILAQGTVRSTSIMPAAPYFEDACRRLAAAGIRQAGVHLTITSEYPPLPIRPLGPPSEVPSLVDGEGRFFAKVGAPGHRLEAAEVDAEFRRQVERARAAGLELTHLDGHMFCYESDVGGRELLAAAESIAVEYDLPLRVRSESRLRSVPSFHMLWREIDDVERRLDFYRDFLLSYDEPLSELVIHPGKDAGAMQTFSASGQCRLADYLFFSAPAFRDLVRAREIEVIGWQQL